MTLGSSLEETIPSPADKSAPLMRFGFPKARNNSSQLTSGLPHPILSTFRFSLPLIGLLLKPSCCLVSYHWHSWDLPFRAFPLKTASHPRQVWLPLKLSASFLHRTSPASECKWIVECYKPKSVLPNNTALTGIDPLPSPFTFNASFTRHWRPILSWASGAF
jgi:hypothetical protein